MGNIPHPEGQNDINGLPVREPQRYIITPDPRNRPDTHTIPPMHLPNLRQVPPGQESRVQPSAPPEPSQDMVPTQIIRIPDEH